MSLALNTNVSGYKKGDIRNAVSFALSSATAQARQRFEHYDGLCRQFEQKYKLSSDEFARQFDSGSLGDEADYFDWYEIPLPSPGI